MTAQTLLRRATGLNLSKTSAERAVRQRMEQNGLQGQDSETYLEALTPEELTQLIELVVVPESWFFRDAQAFSATVEFIQARLARASRPARILSIPCAGGEEPYSMAMALNDAKVPKEAFSIDAYDLSPGCVARAQNGVYGRNAFRAQDTAFRERYFTHLGEDEYRIADSLCRQVNFRQGNLLEFDGARHAEYYDVIFCRNLLIYFDKPTTKAAIARLAAILAADGMLLAGYAEVPSFCQHGFSPLPHRQAFALRKDGPKTQSQETAKSTATITGTAAAATPKRTRPARPIFAATPASPLSSAAAAPRKTPAALAHVPAQAPENLIELARKLADRGHFEEAAGMCRAHLAVAPDSAEAYFILGILSEHAGKMSAAEDYWRRCLYLQPDHYEALCHLALLAEQHGNQAGAANLKARAARIFQRRQA
ncbi:MAG TPA: CheR family methyltransferase [Janthinobacterium sp.]|jgi:chemotaxis protein methyltransferase WspC|nr:CheR family methyltransferase [Janthinobacterium sp.]